MGLSQSQILGLVFCCFSSVETSTTGVSCIDHCWQKPRHHNNSASGIVGCRAVAVTISEWWWWWGSHRRGRVCVIGWHHGETAFTYGEAGTCNRAHINVRVLPTLRKQCSLCPCDLKRPGSYQNVSEMWRLHFSFGSEPREMMFFMW